MLVQPTSLPSLKRAPPHTDVLLPLGDFTLWQGQGRCQRGSPAGLHRSRGSFKGSLGGRSLLLPVRERAGLLQGRCG